MLTYEQMQETAQAIRDAVGGAEIGVVLGSGLGDYVEALEDARYIDYKDIPNFPVSTAPGHAGRWWTGTLHGRRVCMMQGRFHAYEGYGLDEVTLPVRIMKLLGVQTLILTNAAGGVNLTFRPGTLMILTDCINFSGKNPLTGPNLDEFGPRFPDMTHAYDRELIDLCQRKADELGMDCVRQGVYMWFNGPCYETPAEIRLARVVGADAVGMSTVPEAITAAHCGMNVLGFTLCTNMAAGVLDQPLSGEEVIAAGQAAGPRFSALVKACLARL